MNGSLKGSWKSFQKLAAELIFQWMEISRNPDLYEPLPLQTLNIPRHDPPAPSMETDAILKQKNFHQACRTAATAVEAASLAH